MAQINTDGPDRKELAETVSAIQDPATPREQALALVDRLIVSRWTNDEINHAFGLRGGR